MRGSSRARFGGVLQVNGRTRRARRMRTHGGQDALAWQCADAVAVTVAEEAVGVDACGPSIRGSTHRAPAAAVRVLAAGWRGGLMVRGVCGIGRAARACRRGEKPGLRRGGGKTWRVKEECAKVANFWDLMMPPFGYF